MMQEGRCFEISETRKNKLAILNVFKVKFRRVKDLFSKKKLSQKVESWRYILVKRKYLNVPIPILVLVFAVKCVINKKHIYIYFPPHI